MPLPIDAVPHEPTNRWRLPGAFDAAAAHTFPVITRDDVRLVDGGLVYWDAWPLLTEAGDVHLLDDGGRLWFALAAPRSDDPDDRHAHARIHLLVQHQHRFTPLGPALPDGWTPGSREWSGSATIDPTTQRVTLNFTAAGRRGDDAVTAEQRLFGVAGRLEGRSITDWAAPEEILAADEDQYQRMAQTGGEIGKIKALRDPEIFRDPADGRRWVVFTASSARAPSAFDGVIGAALLPDEGEPEILPPLIDATGVNNELERPHIRLFDGRYYLFWVTQAHVFAPNTGGWPTGLYGAVADHMAGPWRLLNGSGLVAANPPQAPAQAYSWFVLPDRTVTSFVDRWGTPSDGNFGGTFAPFVMLALDGEHVHLA